MRILTLTFEGIGPYVGRKSVDFQQLHSGLYLINGPTGAGKTTIIDAITYGLYGKLSGAASDEQRLRSQFAKPHEQSEVNISFETAHGVFRIVRSPAYMRPKDRGQGLTEEKAKCSLFRIQADGEDVQISRLKGEVDKEIERVIGLTHAQFVQTIVLPQGQFATFLQSDTDEREAVLRRIFNTALYENVEKLLSDDAKAVRGQADTADAGVRDAVQRIGELMRWDSESVTPLLRQADLRLDTELLAEFTIPRSELALAQDEAATAAETCGAALDAADALRQLARTEADATSACGKADGALQVAGAIHATAALPLQRRDALANSIAVALDDTDVAGWRQRAAAAVAAAATLKPALQAEQAVADWPALQHRHEQAIVALKSSRVADEARQAELPGLIVEQETIEALRPAAEATAEVTTRATALAEEQQRYSQIETMEASLVQATASTGSALGVADAADRAAATARTAWMQGQAAELAVQLQTDGPCPVCGALEHPAPAQPGEGHVTKSELEALEAAAAAARSAYITAKASLEGTQQQLAGLRATVTMTPEVLASAVRDNAQMAAQLKAADGAATAAANQLRKLRGEAEAVAKRLTASAEALVKANTELEQAQLAHAANLLAAEQGRGAYDTVRSRIDAIGELASELSAMADAVDGLLRAERVQAEAKLAFDALEQREGFGDLAAAQTRWEQASTAKEAAALALAQATNRIESFDRLAQDLERRCTERQQLLAHATDLLHVAGLFRAGGSGEVGLHIHVLRALFVSVIDAANQRLESLLGGRFQLRLAAEHEGDARKRQGLGIEVVDSFGGTARAAKTLSGGETFCASLALSLGLADVVRSNAGGIEIGTLFIDEGFGTLDPGVLDEVLSMLQSLGSNGRLVGVISHVAEMKQAITERIDVDRATEAAPSTFHVSWMPDV